jgi:small subunit ribosomal protein S14
MAKKSSIQKTLSKRKLIAKYSKKVTELKKALSNPELSFEERMAIQQKMESLPSRAYKVKDKNRCWLTGRPRGFHKDFGLCRNSLRLMAHQGMIPGLTKASW